MRGGGEINEEDKKADEDRFGKVGGARWVVNRMMTEWERG